MNEDRVETHKSKIEFNPPRLVKYLEDAKSVFLPELYKITREVELILQRITEVFPNYTLHNIDHSIRIMEYMYDLLSNEKDELSHLEITMLIYGALLHDIGMYVTEKDIALIKVGQYKYSDDSYQAMLKYYGNNEELTLQSYIRKIHADLSALYVREKLQDRLNIPEQPATVFFDEVALICEGHTKDVSWLRQKLKSSYGEKAKYSYNTLYCSLLLRLADIMDIDSQRTPPFLYEMLRLQGLSEEEWKQHFSIENQEKIKFDKETNQKYIVLYGKCNDPAIHRKILTYIDWINFEIHNTTELTKEMGSKYNLKLNPEVDNRIKTEGFRFSNFKLSMDFKAITELLMGEKIYGEKRLGLREIVQNSIDACKLLKEIKDSKRQFYDAEYIPMIKVILDIKSHKVIIRDNGKGMSMDILKKCFLNVGVSYYRSNDFLFKNYKYKPIGTFGIGFLAAFMLSSDVCVRTRHFDEIYRYDINLTKGSEYICLEENDDIGFEGTEVILNYDEFMQTMGNNIETIRNFLSTYFLTDGINIELIIDDAQKIEKINNPLKNEIEIGKNDIYIELGKYLVDIEGYIHLEANKNIYGSKLEDIAHLGETYYYDGENLIKIDPDCFGIDVLYRNCNIQYFEFPILDEAIAGEYDKIYDVLEDQDETLDKIANDSDPEWITVFLNTVMQNEYFKDVVVKNNETIVGDLCFEDLIKFGQVSYRPTKIYVRNFKNYFDITQKLFIPFKEKEDFYFSFFRSDNSRRIYIRNVLVKNTIINILNCISGLRVKAVRINVFNENIMTDLSRNALTEESKKLLDYAISKALHLYAFENLPMSVQEREVFKGFLETFFSQENVLMSNECSVREKT